MRETEELPLVGPGLDVPGPTAPQAGGAPKPVHVRSTLDPRPPTTPVVVLSPDPSVAERVIRPLREGGLRVESVTGAEGVRRRFSDDDPIVAVVDLALGAEAVELVRDRREAAEIVLLTSLAHRQTAARLMRLGASGYVLEPVLPAELLAQVERASADAREHVQNGSRGGRRRRADRRSDRSRIEDRRGARLLASALRHRDGETSAHMERVGRYAVAIATELGWWGGEPETFRLAAALHDLGKIGLPDTVLDKPGRLTPDEFRVVSRHPRIAAAILDAGAEDGGPRSLLHMARTICLYHHERWDGGGYPEGLSRDAIPWEARVVAVADVYDALLHPRPYRKEVPEPVALSYLRFQRGRRFDPRVVDAFFRVLPDIRSIRRERPEPPLSRAVAGIRGRSP